MSHEYEEVRLSMTVQRGLIVGQKREEFTRWLLQILRWEPGDEFFDLFPGSGRVAAEVLRQEAYFSTTRKAAKHGRRA